MALTRNSAKYLYIYYLPTGMFVSVSWVSFLIPAEQIPGRVGLLINLFLVATNIFNTIIDVSPNTEGMTAISAWMIAYMCFVFLEMMEYAVLLYFMMANKAIKIKKKTGTGNGFGWPAPRRTKRPCLVGPPVRK